MKKLLTLGLGVVLLAAFTGLSAAQDGKAGKKLAAIPPANKVTLSWTQNAVPIAGCPVTAWVAFVPFPLGAPSPLAGYTVTFVKISGGGSAPLPGKSNNLGEVKRIVPWNTVTRAKVQSKTLLISNIFNCSKWFDPQSQ